MVSSHLFKQPSGPISKNVGDNACDLLPQRPVDQFQADAPIATNGGPFVVLLFNHRWGGLRTQDTFLTEDLASHGYVVVAIDHPYNAGQVAMPDGRVIKDAFGYSPIDVAERTSTQIRDVWNKELTKWVADEVFVLNTLQNDNLDNKSPWYGRLDTDRAGAFGHSFGGAASVQVCSVDPRVRSALNLDGWTFGDIHYRASNQPIMFLYGANHSLGPQDLSSKDRAVRTKAELDVPDAKQIDASLKQYGGYRLYVDTASHMDFTDHSLVSPWRNWTESGHISSARIQTIVRAYVLAFFDETLRGGKPGLLQSGNSSPFHEVQIEEFAPESDPRPRAQPHVNSLPEKTSPRYISFLTAGFFCTSSENPYTSDLSKGLRQSWMDCASTSIPGSDKTSQ